MYDLFINSFVFHLHTVLPSIEITKRKMYFKLKKKVKHFCIIDYMCYSPWLLSASPPPYNAILCFGKLLRWLKHVQSLSKQISLCFLPLAFSFRIKHGTLARGGWSVLIAAMWVTSGTCVSTMSGLTWQPWLPQHWQLGWLWKLPSQLCPLLWFLQNVRRITANWRKASESTGSLDVQQRILHHTAQTHRAQLLRKLTSVSETCVWLWEMGDNEAYENIDFLYQSSTKISLKLKMLLVSNIDIIVIMLKFVADWW